MFRDIVFSNQGFLDIMDDLEDEDNSIPQNQHIIAAQTRIDTMLRLRGPNPLKTKLNVNTQKYNTVHGITSVMHLTPEFSRSFGRQLYMKLCSDERITSVIVPLKPESYHVTLTPLEWAANSRCKAEMFEEFESHIWRVMSSRIVTFRSEMGSRLSSSLNFVTINSDTELELRNCEKMIHDLGNSPRRVKKP
jgi:hypothetical protein